jgi:hypothetical protein
MMLIEGDTNFKNRCIQCEFKQLRACGQMADITYVRKSHLLSVLIFQRSMQLIWFYGKPEYWKVVNFWLVWYQTPKYTLQWPQTISLMSRSSQQCLAHEYVASLNEYDSVLMRVPMLALFQWYLFIRIFSAYTCKFWACQRHSDS